MKLPNPSDLSRRDFMLAGTTMLALASTGTVQADSESKADGFQAAAVLVGPQDARPQPGDPFFDRKTRYSYVYRESDTGNVAHITQDDSDWTNLMRRPVSASYTGDGTSTGREITLGFEPKWFEIHRDDSSDAEMYEGIGAAGNHSMRTRGGALTTDISRSASVYTTSNGVMIGDGDASHANANGVPFVVVAMA